MNNRKKILFSSLFVSSVAIISSIASVYYFILKKEEDTFISLNSENLEKDKLTKNETTIKDNEKLNEENEGIKTEEKEEKVEKKDLQEIEYDKELEEAPFLEINVVENNLRFQELSKEKFYIDNKNVNLNYSIESFDLSLDKEKIIFDVIITKENKSKKYRIDNFTNFLTEKKYYNNLLKEISNNTILNVEETNKNLVLSNYKKEHFTILNPDEKVNSFIESFSILEDQENGVRTAKILLSFSIEEFNYELEKTISWNFVRDIDVVGEVVLHKTEYKNNLELMLDKTKIPSELTLNKENFSFYIENKGVYIYYNRIERINDFTGEIIIEFAVRKNDIIDFISLKFNDFNKIIKQEEYNINSGRTKMWKIEAINQNSSWSKENVFDDVGYGGKIGRNYWYRNSSNSYDIYFEIIKKDNIPIYVYDLELTFMNYFGYYKDDNYYKIEYKENFGEDWKEADINTKRIEYETIKAIPHVKNTISIKKKITSIRIVFKKNKQPNYYVHISRLMPYIKAKNDSE